jgi:hypothetical protein
MSARRSALDRRYDRVVVPLRKLILYGYFPEPIRRAFRKLKLNPNNEIDWKAPAALLSIHLFSDGKPVGRRPWDTIQQAELLAEVHERRQKSARQAITTEDSN